MSAWKVYTEDEIHEAVEAYADHHEVGVDAVGVTRQFDGEAVIGFRLSLDADGRSRGCDERHGAWGR